MKKLSVILLGTLLCICFALLPTEAQAATVGYLTYAIENGEVTITDCDEDASGKIVIPDTIEGYPVTAIGEGAFWDCTGIKEIVVPNGITVIPNAAFTECETLEKITLPEGVTSIGNGAFADCEYLVSIDIPESVTSIGGWAFLACYKLTAITIPEGVQEIKDRTFAYCNSLTDVTIPETVTSIGAEAFSGCPLSSDFVLSKNISSLGDGVFGRGCGITIPEDHPYFTVDEYGVLFNRDKTKLILALSPIEGKYEVPAGVQAIQGMAFRGCSKLTEIVFPNSVTEIGAYAFSGAGVEIMRLPEGLTTIERNLLAGCKNLVSVYMPDSVTRIEDEAFNTNRGLRNIRFSNNLQYIGQWAFAYNDMASVTLPASLQEVAKGAFSTCTLLTQVTFCGTKTQWQNIKFGEHNQDLLEAKLVIQSASSTGHEGGFLSYSINVKDESVTIIDCDQFAFGEIVIPDTIEGYPVTAIGEAAFYDATDITAVILPKNLKTIGDEAFRYSGIQSIVVPDSVTRMGFCAFDGCWRLKEVTVGAGITTIEAQTFRGCRQLEKITLPDRITEIKQNAFKECHALKSIQLPASLRKIGGSVFSRCENLTSIVIPDGVTVIPSFAFSDCSALAEVVLPNRLTAIERYAFRKCKLMQVQIPDMVTAIGEQAFGQCTELTEITLPSALTIIGPEAFEKCESLTEVLYYGNEDQWNEIEIDNANNGNDALLNAKRTYHTCTWDTIIIEPACQQEGIKEFTCTECGRKKTEKIEALSHELEEMWSFDEATHWRTCVVCDRKLSHTSHIPGPEATEDAAQTCTVCGYELAPKLEKEDPTYWIWIVVGAVILAGGATATVMILKKKRQ